MHESGGECPCFFVVLILEIRPYRWYNVFTVNSWEGSAHMAKGKSIDMTSGSVLGKLILYAAPVIFSSVLQLLFNAADVIVVGQFCGRESLAAVSSNGALINLIVTLFIGLGVGVNVVVSGYYGSKRRDGVSRAVHTAVVVSVVSGLFLAVFGFIFADKLLSLMQIQSQGVFDKAVLYVRIYFIGAPFNLLYNFGATVLSASGDTRRPMIYMIIAGVINVVLNIIFVTVFHLDVAGVALATIISIAVASVLLVIRLRTADEWYKLDFRKLRVHKNELVRIVKIGVPAGLQSMMFSISNVIIQSSINSFGDIAMSGNGASGNIEGFVYVGIAAFAQAAMTFVSCNVGAGKIERVRRIVFTSMACACGFCFIMGGIILLLGEPLLSLYIPGDVEAIKIGFERMVIYIGFYFICAIMDTLVGSTRGLGNSIVPMIVSLVGVCGFRLLWVGTVFTAYRSLMTLYISYPISWTLTAAVQFVCYLIVKRRLEARMAIDKAAMPAPNSI